MIVPGMQTRPTQTSDVAIARFSGRPTQFVNAGTMTMPPPTPRKPERPPASDADDDQQPEAPAQLVVGGFGRRVGAPRGAGTRTSPSSSAVRIIWTWPLPGIAFDATAPSAAKAMPATPVRHATRWSIIPSRS